MLVVVEPIAVVRELGAHSSSAAPRVASIDGGFAVVWSAEHVWVQRVDARGPLLGAPLRVYNATRGTNIDVAGQIMGGLAVMAESEGSVRAQRMSQLGVEGVLEALDQAGDLAELFSRPLRRRELIHPGLHPFQSNRPVHA